MPGAVRFLYGLVMGVSVGIIVSKLIAASGSDSPRQVRRASAVPVDDEKRQAEEASTR